MYTTMILGAIAGLSLFLYGMQLMGDGLQKVAGEGLKGIIRKLTKNRFMSVLVGMFVTTIIQSSSATTVMVLWFRKRWANDISASSRCCLWGKRRNDDNRTNGFLLTCHNGHLSSSLLV